MAQTKKISFTGCQIMKPDEAWQMNPGTKKHYLRPGIVGRVTRNSSAFISSTNRSGKNPQYVRDSSTLTQKQKGEIIRLFDAEDHSVAYIYDPAVAARQMTSGKMNPKKPKTKAVGF